MSLAFIIDWRVVATFTDLDLVWSVSSPVHSNTERCHQVSFCLGFEHIFAERVKTIELDKWSYLTPPQNQQQALAEAAARQQQQHQNQ